eukprot:6198583-Pleurochrysis_carterae.AAC.2
MSSQRNINCDVGHAMAHFLQAINPSDSLQSQRVVKGNRRSFLPVVCDDLEAAKLFHTEMQQVQVNVFAAHYWDATHRRACCVPKLSQLLHELQTLHPSNLTTQQRRRNELLRQAQKAR